jgi:2-polyprenyl-3-methyl-5-hydroxy-6-metoxy-1,4-benzoquinol methylase
VERDDWNRKHGEAGPLFGVEPNRFLVAEVSDLPPGRALDVACGAGRNAVWLAERGWTVTGVDFSDVALENARALAEERGVEVEWVDGDLRDWQPAGAYDLVALLYLHVPPEERRAVLSRAGRAVAPGGTLLVVGHHSDNIAHGTGGPQDPRVLYSEDDVAADLGGLEVEKAEAVFRPVAGERDAIDVLVRASRRV